ncbi:MAG: hypothetical protein L0Z55_06960 [Planctomycetes bacterium]|nr:hypothetical protein [Planctomycetota bacterium]
MQPGFFKRNEKVIMVILLALIAPTFAFTGVMYSALTRSDSDAYSIFGKVYSHSDFARMQIQAANLDRIANSRASRDEDGLDPFHYIIFKEEAKRLQIAVDDAELADIVRGRAIGLITTLELSNDATIKTEQQRQAAFYSKFATTQFSEKAYREALKRFYPGISPKQFEEALRESRTIEKLFQLASSAAVVSNKEIYKEFEQRNQRRAIDYVALPVSGFLDEARAKVAEEAIDSRYAENPAEFKTPLRVALEVYKLRLDAYKAAEPVSEEEIAARYEADKQNRWRKTPETKEPAANEAAGTGGDPAPPAAPEFRPLEEVRDLVKKMIEDEREKLLLGTLNTEAMKQKIAGAASLDLQAALGEKAGFVEVIPTGLFSRDDIATVAPGIGNDIALRRVLSQVGAGTLNAGDYGANVVVVPDGGDFNYKVVEIQKEVIPPLAECRDRVRQALAKEQAMELARAKLGEWKQKVAAKEATLPDLAQAANCTIQSLPALQKNETIKALGADGKVIPGARDLLLSAFAIPEVGELGEPVVPAGRLELIPDVYLALLREIVPPDPLEFTEELKGRIEREVRQRKSMAAGAAYLSSLESRAQITKLYKEIPREPDAEEASAEEAAAE